LCSVILSAWVCIVGGNRPTERDHNLADIEASADWVGSPRL
jgi:hypothetical protein